MNKESTVAMTDPTRIPVIIGIGQLNDRPESPELGLDPPGLMAAALPVVLAARDLRRLAAGKVVPAPRGVADRVAVIWAGWRGRV